MDRQVTPLASLFYTCTLSYSYPWKDVPSFTYICTFSYISMNFLFLICNELGLDYRPYLMSEQAFFLFLGRFVAKALYDRQVTPLTNSQ